jgi:transposase
VRQTEYGYTHVFGAACGATGQSVALVLPHANTAAMNLFLHELSGQLAQEVHAVLVLDNAGWHRSRELIVPANISLLYLPPYAPELNPMERVWKQVKHRHLSNRQFGDEEAVVEACAEAWNLLTAEHLRSPFGTQATMGR